MCELSSAPGRLRAIRRKSSAFIDASPSQPQPSEKRKAAQTSCIRPALKLATRRPSRACSTVRALCRFTAQRPFIPSSMSRITSEGTPRTVDEIGATVTVARWPIALSRVRTRTGRCLSGGANRKRQTSPRLSLPAMRRHPPIYGTRPPAAVEPCTRAGPAPPIPARASALGVPAELGAPTPTDSPFAASPRDRQKVNRSEEHTSELQSPCNLVCRLLLE